MTDNAGRWLDLRQYQAGARQTQETMLAAIQGVAGHITWAEVRHDPPWHAMVGSWSGEDDQSRAAFPQNQSLCDKFLGRVRKTPLTSEDDICFQCGYILWRMSSEWTQ